MYKHKISFLVMAFAFFSLTATGCSDVQKTEETVSQEEITLEDNENSEPVKSQETAEESSLETAEESSLETAEESSLDIEWFYKFSEGLQWIKNGSESALGNGYICVDQEGNALFAINDPDVSYISPFSNGYSFVETKEAVYQIDTSGNVINKYSISDTVTFKAYWEGQIWIEEYNSNFDSAGYTYTLYDGNGKEVTEFSVEGTEPINEINYCGKGVWTYSTYNNNGDWVQMYYCTQSNKWIELPSLSGNSTVYFYEDTAVMGFAYEDPDITGYRAKMILMDTSGNLNEIGISGDLGWNWDDENYVKEGYCILEDYEDHLVSYNISSGEFKVMDNEYAEKLRMEALPDKLMFTDGSVALPLRGNDENDYVGLFDTSWNIVGEPIPCRKFDFSEGKLIVAQYVSEENQEGANVEIIVYDTTGVQIFNAYEKGYKAMIPYKDGIAYVLDADADSTQISGAGMYGNILTSSDISDVSPLYGWKCIDKNGEYLFDKVNVDHVETIELK